MMRLPTLPRSRHRSDRYGHSTERWLLKATAAIFLGLIAYSTPAPDSRAGHELDASVTSTSNSQTTEQPNKDDDIKPGIPILWKFVPADPLSSGSNAGLRALDHWKAAHPTIPLSHVFKAMGDEDEAVQARVAAIIEQQWAMEQYVMDLTFSMTRGDSGHLIPRKPW